MTLKEKRKAFLSGFKASRYFDIQNDSPNAKEQNRSIIDIFERMQRINNRHKVTFERSLVGFETKTEQEENNKTLLELEELFKAESDALAQLLKNNLNAVGCRFNSSCKLYLKEDRHKELKDIKNITNIYLMEA